MVRAYHGRNDTVEPCPLLWNEANGCDIAPTDAAREQAFVHGLLPQSSYLRFHGTLKDLSNK